MKYPKFLQKGDTIGITAPSDGNRKEMDYQRLDLAVKKMESLGYAIRETKNVRTSDGRGRSSEKTERAEQLMSLITDPGVSYIFSAKGGDFLMEILPLLDFRKSGKIRLGFRDFRTIQDLRIPLRHCVIQQVFTGIILTIFPCSHGTMR